MGTLDTKALLSIFLTSSATIPLTAATVLAADDVALFQLLPLVMVLIQRIGESHENRALFVHRLRILRSRVSACRWLKLRFLLMANHPAFSSYWKFKLIHRSHAYAVARHVVKQLVEAGGKGHARASPCVDANTDVDIDAVPERPPEQQQQHPDDDAAGPTADADGGGNSLRRCNAARQSSIPLDDNLFRFQSSTMLNVSDLLTFATHNLFRASDGLHTQNVIFQGRTVHNAFLGNVLIDEIMHRARLTTRPDAYAIAQRLLDIGVVHAVSANRPHTFVDSKCAVYQHRAMLLRPDNDTDTGFNLVSFDAVNALSADVSGAMSLSHLAAPIRTQHRGVRRVEMRIPVDTIDLQSFDFWTKAVFQGKVEVGYRYDYRSIVHPMYSVGVAQGHHEELRVLEKDAGASSVGCGRASQEGRDAASIITVGSGDSGDDGNEGDTTASAGDGEAAARGEKAEEGEEGATNWAEQSAIVGSVVVRKVFASLAQPFIIELQQPGEEADVLDEDHLTTLPPPLLVKMGDNLMQDLGVQMLFRCFNHVWQQERNATMFQERYGMVPVCVGYEVFPTSTADGLMEAVTGLQSLKEFDWDSWKTKYGEDAGMVNEMVRSTAGSYIGTYVMGGRDRHFDNVLVQGESHMLHIDFSYVLGSKPPVDGPSISLAPSMEAAFRNVGVWDKFVDLCVDAFLVLRQHADTLVRVTQLLFVKAGYKDGKVDAFLRGQNSLNVGEKREAKAGDHVRRQITRSSGDVGNWFKEFAHERLVPTWYMLLDKGFPPAKIIMKLRDAQEQGAADKLAATLIDDGHVDDDEKVQVV